MQADSLPTELTWLGLKPSQNPWYLVSGPNEAKVLDVSLQKEFSERQSDRSEVDSFREKFTVQTECGASEKVREAPKSGVVSFYGLSNIIN